MSGYDSTNKRPAEGALHSKEDENTAKRAKIQNNPSPVLHVRSLPPDASEAELISLAAPFGTVQHVLILKGKNQGFIQMDSVHSAATLINYFQHVQPTIRNRPVYIQFSSHSKLNTTSQDSSNPNENPGNVLLVTILNMAYPVTIEVLHQIFSKYGEVMKIITFVKSAGFQALIQYPDARLAAAAKNALEGQNIYNGCCTLRIQYSNLTNLTVKYNNEKSRDFTQPNLQHDEALDVYTHPFALTTPSPLAVNSRPPVQQQHSFSHPYTFPGLDPMFSSGVNAQQSGAPGSVLIISNLDTESHKVTPDVLFTLFGVYADVIRVKILYNKPNTALVQVSNPQQANNALTHLNNVELFGKPMHVNISKHRDVALPKPGTDQEKSGLTKDFTDSPLHRFKFVGSKNYHNIAPPSAVLHVSNLPLNLSVDHLRKLFEEFGEVAGVKFFEKDRRMALVQMESTAKATNALIHLHNYAIEDRNIRISYSKTQIKNE